MSESGWIKWKGGSDPIKGPADLRLRFRNGKEAKGDDSRRWRWSDDQHEYDIVAYKIVQ